jgi:hypothetical protein
VQRAMTDQRGAAQCDWQQCQMRRLRLMWLMLMLLMLAVKMLMRRGGRRGSRSGGIRGSRRASGGRMHRNGQCGGQHEGNLVGAVAAIRDTDQRGAHCGRWESAMMMKWTKTMRIRMKTMLTMVVQNKCFSSAFFLGSNIKWRWYQNPKAFVGSGKNTWWLSLFCWWLNYCLIWPHMPGTADGDDAEDERESARAPGWPTLPPSASANDADEGTVVVSISTWGANIRCRSIKGELKKIW